MTPEQAISEARDGKLRPIYLVLGDEVRLQGDVIAALRAAALEGSVPGLNEDVLQAGEAEIRTVLSAARTLPMLGPRRLVLVRGIERWEKSTSEHSPLEQLVEYAAKASDGSTLILQGTKLDGRRKLVTVAKKGGWLVDCAPLKRRELPGWLMRAAKQRGSELDHVVADLIAELMGPELGPCLDALERVCLYAGDGQRVTEEHVSDCVVKVRSAGTFALASAVGRRDLPGAMGLLDEIYDPKDGGNGLVGMLAWSTRQMIRFESARRRGASPTEAAAKAGAPPFKAQELDDQVRAVPIAALHRWLEVLARVDLDLKGGSRRPPRSTLEQAIIDLCGRGPRRAPSARAPRA